MLQRSTTAIVAIVGLLTCVLVVAGGAPSETDASGSSVLRGATATVSAFRGTAVQTSHPGFPGPYVVDVGVSHQGRPIIAINRRGSLVADRTVVVVGLIHGDERHGQLVTDGLVSAPLPDDLDLWIVPTMNPDGEVLGIHQNSRGVDLNRNWPADWESGTYFSSGRYFSGPSPASEPETRAMMQFLGAIGPEVTIWYHTPWNRVDCDQARVGRSCVDFAARVGSRIGFSPRPGTATDWLMSSGNGVSFVHEFPASAPSSTSVRAHIDAVLALG